MPSPGRTAQPALPRFFSDTLGSSEWLSTTCCARPSAQHRTHTYSKAPFTAFGLLPMMFNTLVSRCGLAATRRAKSSMSNSQRSPGKRSAPGVLDTHALNSPGAALGLTRATCCVCRLAVCRWENVGRQQSPWVPAFAGMTSERRARKSRASRSEAVNVESGAASVVQ